MKFVNGIVSVLNKILLYAEFGSALVDTLKYAKDRFAQITIKDTVIVETTQTTETQENQN